MKTALTLISAGFTIKGQIKSEWIYEMINFQKMNQNVWAITALRVFILHRAEIFWLIFLKIYYFINSFWHNLTFRRLWIFPFKLTFWLIRHSKVNGFSDILHKNQWQWPYKTILGSVCYLMEMFQRRPIIKAIHRWQHLTINTQWHMLLNECSIY